MGKTAMRIIGGIAIVALVAVGGFAIAYPKAAHAVWCNLTVGSVPLDDSEDWDGGESYMGVAYAADSPSQYLDLYVPTSEGDAKPPLFVIIHGGGFVLGDSQTRQAQLMYRYFRDHGYACASVNYRLAAEEPFPGAVCDCKAAIRYLRAHADEYGYDAGCIAVFGESAGGYLAIMCSVTTDEQFNDVPFIGQDELGDVSAHVDVLVDYYGHVDNDTNASDWEQLGIPQVVLDVANSWASPDLLMGYEDFESAWFRRNVSEMTPEEKAVYDPHAYIDANDLSGLSVWIIHGDADITVPYLHSTRLAEHLSQKLGEDAVSLTLVPGMGHASDPLYSDEVLEGLESYLDERLI
ncbi:MAG: alpha/beta hydrolase [Coriobacteriaceae bacterium]|nr:alpha/beta hydrolase [Coriobacteriaceae bacterium]